MTYFSILTPMFISACRRHIGRDKRHVTRAEEKRNPLYLCSVTLARQVAHHALFVSSDHGLVFSFFVRSVLLNLREKEKSELCITMTYLHSGQWKFSLVRCIVLFHDHIKVGWRAVTIVCIVYQMESSRSGISYVPKPLDLSSWTWQSPSIDDQRRTIAD